MEKITLNELPDIFVPVAEIFAQKLDNLSQEEISNL